jgi:hypothetical protein
LRSLSGIIGAAGQTGKNFKAITYTARSLPISVATIGFQADTLLIKDRVNTNETALFGYYLNTATPLPYETFSQGRVNLTSVPAAQTGNTDGTLLSFDPSGFSIGAGDPVCKTAVSSQNFLAWAFKRNENFFDIVNWTGDGNPSQVIPHALVTAPKMIVAWDINNASTTLYVYHASNTGAPETDYLIFNSSAATADLNTVWNDTAPDADDITVGTALNSNGLKYGALLFAEQPKNSKFGTYTGNGNVVGPIIEGFDFTPSAVLIKRTDSGGNWRLYDRNRRNGGATEYYSVQVNSTSPEASGVDVDMQADGFQPQTTNGTVNAAGGTYIFAAFA